MAALARRIGITPKAVEKHIARLKADGILERIGPDKGGSWRIRQRGSLGGESAVMLPLLLPIIIIRKGTS